MKSSKKWVSERRAPGKIVRGVKTSTFGGKSERQASVFCYLQVIVLTASHRQTLTMTRYPYDTIINNIRSGCQVSFCIRVHLSLI